MSDGTLDGFDVDDDGELDPSEALLSDPGRRDPDQGPVDAPEGYQGAASFGTTEQETRTGQSLSALLHREEPELSDDGGGAGDEQYESDGTDDGPDPYWTRQESDLGGVLASVDGRLGPPLDEDQVAQRVGQEGGPGAEDDAVHLIPPA